MNKNADWWSLSNEWPNKVREVKYRERATEKQTELSHLCIFICLLSRSEELHQPWAAFRSNLPLSCSTALSLRVCVCVSCVCTVHVVLPFFAHKPVQTRVGVFWCVWDFVSAGACMCTEHLGSCIMLTEIDYKSKAAFKVLYSLKK